MGSTRNKQTISRKRSLVVEMMGYVLQLAGLITMPFALGIGMWVRSNQGLWWELWIALGGIILFGCGRILIKWGTGSKDTGTRMKETAE